MSQLLASQKLVFIGAGSMAEAIIRGLTHQKKVATDQIHVMNRSNRGQLNELQTRYSIQVCSDLQLKENVIRQANIVILAMKPKDAPKAFAELRHLLTKEMLIISVIAGLSIETMQDLLQNEMQLVRTMPNTSSSIGLGATGLSFSDSTTAIHREIAMEIFCSMGEVSLIDERQFDILTGVSGCGPAYVYYLMEAMISGGIKGGLSEEMARQLTVQTVLGAASMVKFTQENPADLRRKVTSPNGATQAAIETMNLLHFTEAVEKGILRAAERTGELGEMIRDEALKKEGIQ